jgi:hypothetical protein
MRCGTRLGVVAAAVLVAACGATAGGEAPARPNADLKATIVSIADRWVAEWIDVEWNESAGIFKFKHGPYSDAFEHHYVAAVLIGTPESKYSGSDLLARRVVSDLLYHSKVFIEQCGDKSVGGKGLRGYWTLNGASDQGVPVGSGSWQSRSYIRACQLLDSRMKRDEQKAWRDGARWLIAALTNDWKENYGPWWSTNKVSDHVAGVAAWAHVSGDPAAKAYLDRQADWYWRAFADEGLADKYHNYFAKTLYRLAPVLFEPEAAPYHRPLLDRVKMWRSFITDNGFYDAALHHEPNGEESWHSKLGPVMALLLLGSRDDPPLAVVARSIAQERLADWRSDTFMKREFDFYFGLHWGSLGLMIETAPQWQQALAEADRKGPARLADMRFFDYWQGLGRVAVKTPAYQASCYLHWAYTWDFARLGGILHRLTTPGTYRFPDRVATGGGRVSETLRTDTARCWLDWDPHREPETGQERTALVVAKIGGQTLSMPPNFPELAQVTGTPCGRLYGVTHCDYRLGDVLEVRTSNVFLDDAVVVLNAITALKDAEFEALYVQQSLANPGDLVAVTADGRKIEFAAENVRPQTSVSHPVKGLIDLRSKDGTGVLGFLPLANSFARQELVDVALWTKPVGDPGRIPHRVEAWRGHLPTKMKKGETFVADFAYVPHAGDNEFKSAIQIVQSEAAHGFVAGRERDVVGGQAISSGAQRVSIGDFRLNGDLFAAEMSGDKVRKFSLIGSSLEWRGAPVASLSRPAAVTLVPETGDVIFDASTGPLKVEASGKTWNVFSANHEFPRMACIKQSLKESAAAAVGAGPTAPVADVKKACADFGELPQWIDVAVRLAELDMLCRSAEVRGGKVEKARDLLLKVKEALKARDKEKTERLAAEAAKEILALHATADKAGKPVAAVSMQDPEAVLAQQATQGSEKMPVAYLISFAEEKGRAAIMRRAVALYRSPASAGAAAERLIPCAESKLLKDYYGLPIRWTREHIPGQPDFFWRPLAAAGEDLGSGTRPEERRADAGGPVAPPTAWEKTLTKYIHPTNRVTLALARLEAANALIGE